MNQCAEHVFQPFRSYLQTLSLTVEHSFIALHTTCSAMDLLNMNPHGSIVVDLCLTVCADEILLVETSVQHIVLLLSMNSCFHMTTNAIWWKLISIKILLLAYCLWDHQDA